MTNIIEGIYQERDRLVAVCSTREEAQKTIDFMKIPKEYVQ